MCRFISMPDLTSGESFPDGQMTRWELDLVTPERTRATRPAASSEKVVELTYRLILGEHIFVQPDLQFHIHPGARESAATAVVAGLRLNLSY